MTFDYSLASMLPFARSAIRNASDFDLQQFVDLVFGELEKARVPGVVKEASTGIRKYNQGATIPQELKSGTIEALFYLEHRGFVLQLSC